MSLKLGRRVVGLSLLLSTVAGSGLSAARGQERTPAPLAESSFEDWEAFQFRTAERFEALWPHPAGGHRGDKDFGPIRVRWATDREALSGRVAVTEGRQILVRPGTESLRLAQVLEHELAHIFTSERCARYEHDPWVSELIAQLFSQDHERIRGGRFVFQTEALRFVEEAERDPRHRPSSDDPRWGESASRVLLSLEARAWDSGAFWGAVQRCDPKGVRNTLGLALRREIPKGTPRWILLETQSGAVVSSEGAIDETGPLSSVMKSALVAWSPAFRKKRRSRPSDPAWACEPPKSERVQSWSADQALAASCNGFFLDAARDLSQDDRVRIAARLRALGFQGVEANQSDPVPEWIGLRPGLRGSVRQVGELYRLLARTAPEVIAAMKQTARQGTLAALKTSPWFLKRKIALKTGTHRTPDAQPIEGWIVAVTPAWTLVVAQKGEVPRHLASWVQQKLAALESQTASVLEPVEVQVLSLLHPSQVEWSCAGLGVQEWGRSPHVDDPGQSPSRIERALNGREPGPRISCYGASLIATYRDSRGIEQRRSFYGSLEWQEPAPPGSEERGRDRLTRPRSLRARRGSPWIFRTTEREYLRGILLNEGDSLRVETWKALALVAAWNVRRGGGFRHPAKTPSRARICDSTHCQVAGGVRRGPPPALLRTRLEETLSSISGERLDAAEPWLPFSLGGTESWTRALPLDFWQTRLGWSNVALRLEAGLALQVQDGRLQGSLAGQPWASSCEWFREQLQLPSCPQEFALDSSGFLKVSGIGEGHGLGLSLREAEDLASEGRSYREILGRFFPKVRIVSRSGEKLVQRDRP